MHLRPIQFSISFDSCYTAIKIKSTCWFLSSHLLLLLAWCILYIFQLILVSQHSPSLRVYNEEPKLFYDIISFSCFSNQIFVFVHYSLHVEFVGLINHQGRKKMLMKVCYYRFHSCNHGHWTTRYGCALSLNCTVPANEITHFKKQTKLSTARGMSFLEVHVCNYGSNFQKSILAL